MISSGSGGCFSSLLETVQVSLPSVTCPTLSSSCPSVILPISQPFLPNQREENLPDRPVKVESNPLGDHDHVVRDEKNSAAWRLYRKCKPASQHESQFRGGNHDRKTSKKEVKSRKCRRRREVVMGPGLPAQRCEWCGGLEFAYFKFLRHIRLLHPEQLATVTVHLKASSRLRCRLCDEGALSRVDLSTHMAQSHPGVRVQTVAPRSVERETSFCENQPQEEQSTPPLALEQKTTLCCQLCSVGFANRDQLADHENRLHINRPLAYSCTHCGKQSYAGARAFKNHLNLHLPRESLCIKCGATFPTLYELKEHHRTAHVRERMPRLSTTKENRREVETAITNHVSGYVCHICARRFTSTNSLNSHLRNVHRPETEQLACARCFKLFNTRRALAVHAQLHEEPRLACPHCPKMLHTSLYLKGKRLPSPLLCFMFHFLKKG